LTYDLDFQSPVNYSHDPLIQKLKFKNQSVQKIEWKQTDGQTDTIVCFAFAANTISNGVLNF